MLVDWYMVPFFLFKWNHSYIFQMLNPCTTFGKTPSNMCTVYTYSGDFFFKLIFHPGNFFNRRIIWRFGFYHLSFWFGCSDPAHWIWIRTFFSDFSFWTFIRALPFLLNLESLPTAPMGYLIHTYANTHRVAVPWGRNSLYRWLV